MNRGLKRRWIRDHRRYSYNRTFGSVSTIPDFTVDVGLGLPDQNEYDPYFDNQPFPEGCTAFSVSDSAQTDLKQRVNPKFTLGKTSLIANGPDGGPFTLQDAYKSGTVYGVQLKGETDSEALAHRRAPYFEVHPDSSHDWFDALLSACYTSGRPVSVGTTWIFENVGPDGIQRVVPTAWVGGHAWNIVGKKTINGVEYAIGKTWNGTNWGDHGWTYFPREILNATMRINGSDALTNRPAAPGDIKVVELTIIQVLISYLYRLLAITSKTIGSWFGSS